MQKDQNVSMIIENSSVMSFLFLFSLFFHVSLFLFSSLTLIMQFIIEEMKNISLSSDSFLSMTSSFFSSSTLIMRSIIEEMKNAVSFDIVVRRSLVTKRVGIE